MKTLKLLNKKNLSIIIFSLLLAVTSFSEEKPVDIWNIDKKEVQPSIDNNDSEENVNNKSEESIYELQVDKNIDTIKFDQTLTSKEIKIAGLYDPEEYGLSINMWSNSDGLLLKKLFKSINDYNLSKDASEILNISL